MKYLKLFEELRIEEKEFPIEGHDLSPRERKILTYLVGSYLNYFKIKVDDHYYYVRRFDYCNKVLDCNVFDNFNELKDYLISCFYMIDDKPKEHLQLLKKHLKLK